MAQETTHSLKGIRLLETLSADEIKQIEKLCGWQSYKAGEEILTQNSDSMDVYFVVSGSVQVVSYSFTGREIAYAVIETGGYFGELAAIDQKPRSTNVKAAKKCLVATLSPNAFEQIVRNHGDVAWAVMNKLARIIRSNDERIMDLSTLDAHQRIFQELLRICEPDPVTPGRWMIYPLPTQHDIASLVSTTRETVARALSSLTSSGLVQRKGRTLYITDKDQLSELTSQLSNKA